MMLREQKHKSQVAILIDTATNGGAQQEENWSLFMHICDLINRSHDVGAKDAAKAIRKRLGCKVPEDICLTLKLLETCMKNCGRLFHVHVATQKFMQELVKVISPKHYPSIGMQNKVLGLIQAWEIAFRTVPELREFHRTYQDLKLKGVEFPPPDPEMAIIPKQPTAKVPAKSVAHTRPTEEGNKIGAELTTVRNNCKILGEMLTEMRPGQETAADLELLEDLNTTCREMQKRLTELIESGRFEQHMEELLLVNDELNNAFLRYDRFQRMRSQHPAPGSVPQPFQLEPNHYQSPDNIYDEASSIKQQSTTTVYDNASSYNTTYDTLIDLATDVQPASVPGLPVSLMDELSMYDNIGVPGRPFENTTATGFPSNFDPFVLPSQLPWQSTAASTKPSSSGAAAKVVDKESDFDEMEKWLKANPRASNIQTEAGNDEFDRFLSARAREIEQLPNVNASQTEQSKTSDPSQSELLLNL